MYIRIIIIDIRIIIIDIRIYCISSNRGRGFYFFRRIFYAGSKRGRPLFGGGLYSRKYGIHVLYNVGDDEIL